MRKTQTAKGDADGGNDVRAIPDYDGDASQGRSLSAVTREFILSGIKSGKYPPGSRIPEREISDALGVSRTPVREAIRNLQNEGLLVIKPNTGAEVTSLSAQGMIELYTFRTQLEEFATREAAKYISDAELELLDGVIAHSEDSLDDMQAFAKLNRELHASIHRAARNQFLLQALKMIDTYLALLPGWSNSLSHRAGESHEEHKEIVKAIRQRDPEAAALAMRVHIKNTQSSYIKTAIHEFTRT